MGLIEALEAILGSVFVLGSLPFVMHRVERTLDQPVSSPRHGRRRMKCGHTAAANRIWTPATR